MNKNVKLTNSDILSAVGLIAVALGILTQIFSGVSSATVPVGAIVMLSLAGLIFLRLWQWSATVGAVVAVLITAGAFIAPGLTTWLSNPAKLGPFVGTVLQLAGLATTLIAGIAATVYHYNHRNRLAVSQKD